MKSKFALMLGTTLAIYAMPAVAQGAPESTGSEGDQIVVTGKYTIADEIDTATGLGLSVQETPQSVSIVTAQRILDQNLISVKDVIENGIGVAVNETDDVRNSFFARGFEIQNTQIDGVPTAWALGGDRGETLADLSIYERVEIVRGATGLLSGVGDPSASINLVRKHADRTEWAGYANAAYGSWDTWRLSGDVGGAVTSDGRLRVRGVARYEEGNAFTDYYSNKKLVLYGTIEADVTDDTLLRVGFSHQRNNPTGVFWGSLPTFYSDGTIAEWRRSKTTAQPWTTWKTTNQNFFTSLSHDFGNGWSIQGNYNRQRNSQFTQILYLSGQVDRTTGLGLASNPYSAYGVSTQNSYDAQLKGKLTVFGRDHDLVLGYLNSTLKRSTDSYCPLNGDPICSYNFPAAGDFNNWNENSYPNPGFLETGLRVEQERIKQIGYYGALRLNVTDWLKFIGGGRLATWRRNGEAYGTQTTYGDKNVFIPYAGALVDVTANHRIYASYTTIYQPQNLRNRNYEQLDPITGKSYEIGLKSNFFNEALQTSVALFRIEQDNLGQIDGALIPVPGGGPTFQPYRAAQGAVSKGFEVEATGEPLEGWNINAGYSQFKVRDSDGLNVNTDQPRRLLKVFSTYTLQNILNGFTFGGGVNYRSSAYSATNGVPFQLRQKGFALVNLMARLAVTEQFEVQANVENLLDKTYYSQVGNFSQYRYGEPRSFMVSANYRF